MLGSAPHPVPDRPLLATSDPDLLDDLLRVCAAAGVEAQVAHDVTAARGAWLRAPLVVLGDELSVGALRAGLVRRPDVVVVVRDLGDGTVWQRASALGADGVILLPDAESLLLARLATSADDAVPEGVTVSVVGGRGGAGASALACALAVTGTARCRTLLLDADPLGGGLDLVVGAEHVTGLRWPEVASARGRVSPGALRDALPAVSGLSVLSWDRGRPCPLPADAASCVLEAARRSHGLVVADLPRSLDAAAEVVAAESDLVLLLVPAEVRAAAAAARVAAAVGLIASDLRVVVRGPAPSGLTGPQISGSLGLPFAGWLRPEPGIVAGLERGDAPARSGRGPLAELCTGVLDGLLEQGRAAA